MVADREQQPPARKICDNCRRSEPSDGRNGRRPSNPEPVHREIDTLLDLDPDTLPIWWTVSGRIKVGDRVTGLPMQCCADYFTQPEWRTKAVPRPSLRGREPLDNPASGPSTPHRVGVGVARQRIDAGDANPVEDGLAFGLPSAHAFGVRGIAA